MGSSISTPRALLFTTDGDLAQALLHPSRHVTKRYVALVDGVVSDDELEPLRSGMMLDDGLCKPAPCRVLAQRAARAIWNTAVPHGTSVVEVELSEGRKNQVKRMLGRVHHPCSVCIAPHLVRLSLAILHGGRGGY